MGLAEKLQTRVRSALELTWKYFGYKLGKDYPITAIEVKIKDHEDMIEKWNKLGK
jgi:hypothetical protein